MAAQVVAAADRRAAPAVGAEEAARRVDPAVAVRVVKETLRVRPVLDLAMKRNTPSSVDPQLWKNNGDGSFTYTPPADFTGLDEAVKSYT